MARGAVATLLVLCATGAIAARAAVLVQNRIAGAIRSGNMQTLPGTVHPKVALAQDQGQLSGSTPIQDMSLVFRRSAAQEADLKQLLREQQTPGSPEYHQWLRPGRFAARYGMSASDLAKAVAWLQSQGFTIEVIPASHDRIVFSGTAAQVDAAFQTEMHRYSLHGKTHWANATNIRLPQALANVSFGIKHLNTFRPRPHAIERSIPPAHRVAGAKPNYTLQCQANQDGCPASGLINFIAPADSQTIYDVSGLYNSGFTGSGQTLAIAGQTDITQHETDIANFRSLSGLDASNLPTQVLVTIPNTGPATVSVPDLAEADIDNEWSGAVAKDAKIVYVTVGSNQNYSVFDALTYAVQNPLANNDTQFVPVISISYGACEQVFEGGNYLQQMESVLEQANAQGQTIVASSGDYGSATCDDSDKAGTAAYRGLSVDYPASSQYVTGVGGTSFSGDLVNQPAYWSAANSSSNGSALSYIPETVWNSTPNAADLSSVGQLSASGGGASALFSKPSWQAGPGVLSDGKRDVPDISLAADPNHDGYVLCTQETNSAGTQLTGISSCAYPVGSNQVPYFDASGNGYLYGGTSIAAPQMAAMITLWNQEAGNTAGVGNANPIFYLAAQNDPGAFHDITTGSNAVVCQKGSPNCISNGSGGYVMSCCSAGSGYDMATGLGSVDAAAMGAIWPQVSIATGPGAQPTFTLLLNPNTVSVSPGNSVTTSVVLDASGAGGNSQQGFSGTVSLACSNLPAGVTCSFSPATATLTSGASQTVTLTLNASVNAAAVTAARQSPSAPFRHGWPMQMAFAGVFGLSFLGWKRKKCRFPSRWMTVLLLGAGLAAASALTACGGGSAGSTSSHQTTSTTPVTQTVTVTGTSGTTSASAQIKITVL